MLMSGGFFKHRVESLGMGSNYGSIAEHPCFEMKMQTEPSAEGGRLTK